MSTELENTCEFNRNHFPENLQFALYLYSNRIRVQTEEIISYLIIYGHPRPESGK